jgi:hypothetical protein
MLTPLYACPPFYAAAFLEGKRLEDENKKKKQNYHIYSQILSFFSCFMYQRAQKRGGNLKNVRWEMR